MLHSIRELCRFRVLATDGKVGRAADFYFSDSGWAVCFVVVNTGRLFPGRRVLVPPDYVGVPNGPRRRLPIALTRRELESCARPEAHEPVSLRQQHLIQQRYGGALYGQGGEPVSEAHGAVSPQALAIAEAALEAPPAEQGSLRSGQEVIGYHVEAEDGAAGVIDDLLVDDESWKTQYFVIDTKDWRSMNPRVLMAPTWIQDVSWAESKVYIGDCRYGASSTGEAISVRLPQSPLRAAPRSSHPRIEKGLRPLFSPGTPQPIHKRPPLQLFGIVHSPCHHEAAGLLRQPLEST